MKSLFTTLIAITLFVLCLLEKEAKQQDLLAQRLKEQASVNQKVNNSASAQLIYAKAQKDRILPMRFELAEFAVSDSTANSAATSGSM